VQKNIFKNKPFLIAEISANHCGNIGLAKKLIDTAKNNGADAVKLQTFSPDTMTIKADKKDFKIKEGLWKGYNLWNLYEKAQTPYSWHKELFNYAKRKKIICFSTPFDETAVELLEKLNTPVYKISSFEMTDIPLIKKIAKTKKPIIMSTGLSNLDEIELSFKTAKKFGCKDITLLYCVSAYPAKESDINLNNINILKKKFGCRVGFSDHTKNTNIACAAIAMGAEVIEKHIALNGQKKGLDIKFSLKGKEILSFKKRISETYKFLGLNKFKRSKNEMKNKKFRRSIYAYKNIEKGEKFSKKNIKVIRPGYGLDPKYFEQLIGKKSPKKIKIASRINLKIFKMTLKK